MRSLSSGPCVYPPGADRPVALQQLLPENPSTWRPWHPGTPFRFVKESAASCEERPAPRRRTTTSRATYKRSRCSPAGPALLGPRSTPAQHHRRQGGDKPPRQAVQDGGAEGHHRALGDVDAQRVLQSAIAAQQKGRGARRDEDRVPTAAVKWRPPEEKAPESCQGGRAATGKDEAEEEEEDQEERPLRPPPRGRRHRRGLGRSRTSDAAVPSTGPCPSERRQGYRRSYPHAESSGPCRRCCISPR